MNDVVVSECTLENVDTLFNLELKQGGIVVVNEENAGGISTVLTRPGITITTSIPPATVQLQIDLQDCSMEGLFSFTINNGTDSNTIHIWLISKYCSNVIDLPI